MHRALCLPPPQCLAPLHFDWSLDLSSMRHFLYHGFPQRILRNFAYWGYWFFFWLKAQKQDQLGLKKANQRPPGDWFWILDKGKCWSSGYLHKIKKLGGPVEADWWATSASWNGQSWISNQEGPNQCPSTTGCSTGCILCCTSCMSTGKLNRVEPSTSYWSTTVVMDCSDPEGHISWSPNRTEH